MMFQSSNVSFVQPRYYCYISTKSWLHEGKHFIDSVNSEQENIYL